MATPTDTTSLDEFFASILTPKQTQLAKGGSGLSKEETESELAAKESAARKAQINEAEANRRAAEAEQALKERRDEHELRKSFLDRVFSFATTVVFFALIMTFCVSAGILHLSDTVLVTLLTATIAHVLGSLFIAFKWLFPQRKKK